jgi:hypothetical protein
LARQLARRRQRERIAGILVAGIGFAVLIVAIFALREPNGHVAAAQSGQRTGASNVARNSTSPHPTKSTSSAPRTDESHASFKVKDVPLIVVNNTTVTGLAAQAAQRFEAGGWTVTSVGNYQNSILSTCAYYDPSVSGAKAAATALQRQYPTIKRVEPRFAPSPEAEPLPSGPVVVVLTPDYSSA